MSKSKGDFLTVSLLEEKKYNPLSYRLLCLQSHYRKQLIFSFENLDNAQNAYKKLKQRVLNLLDSGDINKEAFDKYNNLFISCINDDMNTSSALTVLYDVLKDETINDKTKKELIESFDKVLSLSLLDDEEEIDDELIKYIEEQINLRKIAKENKDYAKADEIRNNLLEKGIELKDTREGIVWSKI